MSLSSPLHDSSRTGPPTVVTKPLRFAGSKLQLNVHTGGGGSVNLFGPQRVGYGDARAGRAVRPFDVGRAMLQGDWAAVVRLLLQEEEWAA